MGRRVPSLVISRALGLQLARSFFMLVTTSLFFIGVFYLPLTTASTIMFMAPVIVTMLSIPMLGEQVGMRRWLGIACAFLGALIVIRPVGGPIQWTMLILLAAAFTHALYQIYTRKTGTRDHPLTSLLYTGVLGAVGLSGAVVFYWQPVALSDWPLFLGLGILGGIGHLFLIRAFHNAPASVVAPFSYSSLLWAIVFGFILFGDLPDSWTLTGAALIIASGLYIFHREQLAKKSS